MEKELDALIAGAGEALRLEWTDIDFERCIITLNKPEKRSNPRM